MKKKQNDKKGGFLNEFKKEEKIGYFNSKWVWFMENLIAVGKKITRVVQIKGITVEYLSQPTLKVTIKSNRLRRDSLLKKLKKKKRKR